MIVDEEPEILWRPSPEAKDKTSMDHYRKHVNQRFNRSFANSPELQKWSVANPQLFWMDLYEYLGLVPTLPSHVTRAYDESAPMSSIPPFFEGLNLNYAENVLLNADRHPENVALIGIREGQDLGPEPEQLTWKQLRDEVREVSTALRKCEVKEGDVVNVKEKVMEVLQK